MTDEEVKHNNEILDQVDRSDIKMTTCECGFPFIITGMIYKYLPADHEKNDTGKPIITIEGHPVCFKCGRPFNVIEAINRGVIITNTPLKLNTIKN